MMTQKADDTARAMLRHTLATLAYRAAKAVRDAPAGFESYSPAEGSRTPGQILAHMGDLMDWAFSLAKGPQTWHDSAPLPWEQECQRFFDALARLDVYLASDAPLDKPIGIIFQGPVADALTHTGQINMLRRMAGGPVRGENYARADIGVGQTGRAQPPPRREFD